MPLARWSLVDVRRDVLSRGVVARINGTTLWRWLDADAIRPWRHRTWVFSPDPQFAERGGTGRVSLRALLRAPRARGPCDYVISADEKTSIQARHRCHRSAAAAPGRPLRVEHEYARRGAWAYVGEWESIHNARLFGRCQVRNGIAPFDRRVD